MLLRSLSLALLLAALVGAQYETYSFKSFPQKDIMPLESAYGYALELYAEQNWAESVKFLELSLRLHRLLRDGETFCSRNCSAVSRDNDTALADNSLRVVRLVLLRAACVKRCKADFPVFRLSYPRRDLLEAFEQRVPYRYIQYAQYQVPKTSALILNGGAFPLILPPCCALPAARAGAEYVPRLFQCFPPETIPLFFPPDRRGVQVLVGSQDKQMLMWF